MSGKGSRLELQKQQKPDPSAQGKGGGWRRSRPATRGAIGKGEGAVTERGAKVVIGRAHRRQRGRKRATVIFYSCGRAGSLMVVMHVTGGGGGVPGGGQGWGRP